MIHTVALLDLSNGWNSRGVPSIREICSRSHYDIDVHDVRVNDDVPTLEELREKGIRKVISTGGPGDPRDEGEDHGLPWREKFYKLYEDIIAWNEKNEDDAIDVLLICHSAQVMAERFGLVTIEKRENDEKLQGVLIHDVHPDAVTFKPYYAPHFQAPLAAVESRYWRMLIKDDAFGPSSKFVILSTFKDNGKTALTGYGTKDGHLLAFQFHPEAIPAQMEVLLNGHTDPAIDYQNTVCGASLDVMRENLEHLPKTHSIVDRFLQLAA